MPASLPYRAAEDAGVKGGRKAVAWRSRPFEAGERFRTMRGAIHRPGRTKINNSDPSLTCVWTKKRLRRVEQQVMTPFGG